jgi:type VI secretion system protein ImpH
MFQHRMSSLLYRAWADAQPVIGLDRAGDDRFATYVRNLCGLEQAVPAPQSAIEDGARLGAAGLLGDRRRHASGLATLLSDEFEVPVRIESFVGRWLPLPDAAGVRLGSRHRGTLGAGYVLGRRVWDRQQKFRVVIGPLSAAQCERLQPGTARLRRLAHWVRLYAGPTQDFELELKLAHDAAPAMRLGPKTRLGRHTWLGSTRSGGAAPALRFDGDIELVRTLSKEQAS